MRKLILGLLLLLPGCALVAAPPGEPPTPPPISAGPDLALFQLDLVDSLQPSLPVELQVVDTLLETQRLGRSWRWADGYVIQVDSRLDPRLQAEVLVHEWAHVMRWDTSPDRSGAHDEEWGKVYSKVFRVAVGELP